MTQIIDSVAELHSKGYVHRDLKPANLLVTDSGNAIFLSFLGNLKLSDFGLVIKEGNCDLAYCGTPSYMCPERL